MAARIGGHGDTAERPAAARENRLKLVRDAVVGFRCYAFLMSLPFDPKRSRAYEIEFGAGGQRMGCKFLSG
jgi:hypothetical protein